MNDARGDGAQTDDGSVGTALAVRRAVMMLYVDRSSQRWIVREPDGRLWQLPATDQSWLHREPFHLTDETVLEAVPGHYKYVLGIPL